MLTVVICSNIHAQIRLKGFVKSMQTQQPLVGSTIKNLQNQKLYSTNKFGAFGITVNEFDTLVFSYLGYKDFYHIATQKDSLLTIWLEPTTYALPTFALKLPQHAKAAAKLLQTDSLLNHMETYSKWPKGAEVIVGTGFICAGCINALWYKYSKRGKEINAINQAVALYQQQLRADDKWMAFTTKYARIFGNKTNEELLQCRPNNTDLLKFNDYDLINYLQKCLQLH